MTITNHLPTNLLPNNLDPDWIDKQSPSDQSLILEVSEALEELFRGLENDTLLSEMKKTALKHIIQFRRGNP